MKFNGFVTPCLVLIWAGLFLSGCLRFQAEPAAEPAGELPARYSMYSSQAPAGDSTGDPLWWRRFDAPELNGLVDQALGRGFSVREARARLDQARALYDTRRASLWPSLSGEAGYTVKDNHNTGTSETTSLGLAAAYEVDLWGRIAAGNEAAWLGVEARRADLAAAAVTLAATVAESWVDLIAVRGEIDLVQAQIQTGQALENLIGLRVEKSMSTALDLLQQQKAVQRSQSTLPALKARETLLMQSLALLTGQAPGTPMPLEARAFPALPPLPDQGLPADLLAMRPDVRAAGLRLKAADWEVAASRADRLPALSISAGLSYSGEGLSTLFDNWIANLAGNLTGPIFDAGKKKAQVAQDQAVARERLAAYQRIVLTAIKEVEENLINESMQGDTLDLVDRELKTSRLLLREAERHYTRGLDSYLPVVSALVQTQDLEISRIRGQAALIKYRIGIYRSLGGAWTRDLTLPTSESK